jgi:hypothetical protein
MAVVQISRIQVRRGKKNVSGLPQLASGEFGWAVDTQELFIGNGAVSEGSPSVGNTKILTENDSLIDFALEYQYKKNNNSIQTGSSTSLPIRRTMQDKIDERVSVKDFGAIGDGQIDDTLALQRAIDQLFNNSSNLSSISSRVVLMFEPGIYRIVQPLKIPSNARIMGAGKDRTIIRQVETVPVISLDKTPTTSDPDIRTVNVYIESLTLESTRASDGLFLKNVQDSKFKDIKIKGNWIITDSLSTAGIDIQSSSDVTSSRENIFDSCEIHQFGYGIRSDYNVHDNVFDKMVFKDLGKGINFGVTSPSSTAQETGPHRNKITNSSFLNIKEHGINILRGYGNSSINNSFMSVGNDGGDHTDAVYPVLYLVESVSQVNNISFNDYIDRAKKMSTATNLAYIPDVSGSTVSENKFTKTIPVPANASNPITLFRLPIFDTLGYKIHYLHKSSSNNTVRFGVITATVNKLSGTVSLIDEYDFSGNANLANNLKFTAQMVDLDSDQNQETIRIQYTNQTTTDNNVNSLLSYWYESIS